MKLATIETAQSYMTSESYHIPGKTPWDSIPVENTCLHTTPSLADVAIDEYHDPDLYFTDFAIINNKVV